MLQLTRVFFFFVNQKKKISRLPIFKVHCNNGQTSKNTNLFSPLSLFYSLPDNSVLSRVSREYFTYAKKKKIKKKAIHMLFR